MLILSSNGLTSPALLEAARVQIRPWMQRAALVTTASLGYKEQDRHVPQRLKELDALGLAAECFDFDDRPARSFANYDAAVFLGGNPFYLLKSLRACGAAPILKGFLEDEKLLIGCSAGSLVMQRSIALIARYSPELNDSVGLLDTIGLGLTDVEILPHYHRFLPRFEHFEKRAQAYERETGIPVLRIDDGQAVFLYSNGPRVEGTPLSM